MGTNRHSLTAVIANKNLGIWEGIDATGFIDDVESGAIESKEHIFKRGERLDHLAYKYYNDPTYWWIIAFVNRIGYILQIRPGTKLLIPPLQVSLERIMAAGK